MGRANGHVPAQQRGLQTEDLSGRQAGRTRTPTRTRAQQQSTGHRPGTSTRPGKKVSSRHNIKTKMVAERTVVTAQTLGVTIRPGAQGKTPQTCAGRRTTSCTTTRIAIPQSATQTATHQAFIVHLYEASYSSINRNHFIGRLNSHQTLGRLVNHQRQHSLGRSTGVMIVLGDEVADQVLGAAFDVLASDTHT